MANQSILHTKRQISRAKATAARTLGSEGEQWMALRCIAPDFVASAGLFERADARVRQLQAEVREKSTAASSALPPLGRLYEEARQIAGFRLGVTPPGASTFGTPDDLLNSAQDLADHFALCMAQPGIGPLSSALRRALAAAAAAQGELSSARKGLQRAQHEREAAAGQLRPLFVCFRRLVRCAFGKCSREYRELLDRRQRARWPESDELDPAPPTASGNPEDVERSSAGATPDGGHDSPDVQSEAGWSRSQTPKQDNDSDGGHSDAGHSSDTEPGKPTRGFADGDAVVCAQGDRV